MMLLPVIAQSSAAGGRFATLDWAVLVGYALLLLVTGWWFNRRPATDTGDFFLGGRRMPVWAVAVSVLATSLSAATFIGGPQQAYAGNLTYLASNIGMILAAIVVAWLLLPRMYREDAATPYALLERRFGPTGRGAAAAAFLGGRVMASGARVFIIGIPAALVLFGVPEASEANPEGLIPEWQIVMAILVISVVGVVYTLAGGVRSVIWTDVIQMVVLVSAVAGAIVLLLDRIPGGAEMAFGALRTARDDAGVRKLAVFDLSLDLRSNYSLLACCTGFVLFGIAAYGLDQDLVQRMLTCRSAARGAWSVISATLVGVPVVALFMVVGLLLYVFYQRADVMGDGAPGYAVFDSSRIFLSFILRELPPGLSGLMMAGLFAAGLSSLNSGLNSMSSTVVNDFYRRLAPGRDERHYLRVGRIGVVGWGIALGGFACLCVYWQQRGGQTLIDFALGVMTFAYAGLLGVFFTLLLTRRGNGVSVVAALLVGFVAIFVMNRAACELLFGAVGRVLGRPAEASGLVEIVTARDDVLGDLVAWLWSLGFVWKLMLGSVAAFGVCAAGRARAGADGRSEKPRTPGSGAS